MNVPTSAALPRGAPRRLLLACSSTFLSASARVSSLPQGFVNSAWNAIGSVAGLTPCPAGARRGPPVCRLSLCGPLIATPSTGFPVLLPATRPRPRGRASLSGRRTAGPSRSLFSSAHRGRGIHSRLVFRPGSLDHAAPYYSVTCASPDRPDLVSMALVPLCPRFQRVDRARRPRGSGARCAQHPDAVSLSASLGDLVPRSVVLRLWAGTDVGASPPPGRGVGCAHRAPHSRGSERAASALPDSARSMRGQPGPSFAGRPLRWRASSGERCSRTDLTASPHGLSIFSGSCSSSARRLVAAEPMRERTPPL